MRMLLTGTICAALLSTSALAAPAAPADPYGGETAFRSLYKELVETNTTLSSAVALWRPSVWRRGSRRQASPTIS